MPNVKRRPRTMASGVYDHGYVLAEERPESRAAAAALADPARGGSSTATGAIERPLAFAGNDVPGVMLASAVRDYLALWGVSVGERTVVVTNNDDAYRTAIALRQRGPRGAGGARRAGLGARGRCRRRRGRWASAVLEGARRAGGQGRRGASSGVEACAQAGERRRAGG